MWQPEQPSSQMVASRGLTHRARCLPSGEVGEIGSAAARLGDRPPLLEERPGGAHLDALAAAGAGVGLAPGRAQVGDQPGLGAPSHHVPGVSPLDLVADAHAAGAEDAAVVVDPEALVRRVHTRRGVELGELEVGEPQPDREVLQLAVPIGHADRADVVALGVEQLHDPAAVSAEAVGVDRHRHPLFDGGHAGGKELALPGHLDHAEAAGADVREPVEMAEGGDLDAVLGGDLENGAPGRAGDVPTLDGQGENAHRRASAVVAPASGGSITQTPAGQTWSSMWARYSSRK